MKHKIGDVNRIKHIVEAINDIEDFLKNVDKEAFFENREKRSAVERMLEIIGEATNHISAEIIYDKKYSTSWRHIIATRNLIAHEYFRIDYDVIYEIATKEIIPLKEEILLILKDLEQDLI